MRCVVKQIGLLKITPAPLFGQDASGKREFQGPAWRPKECAGRVR
jgi:hypothetical protein